MRDLTSKSVKILLNDLEKQGCRVAEKSSGGWMIYFPDGVTSTTIHQTESDHRAIKNTRARVLRAGLTWVFDPQNRKK